MSLVGRSRRRATGSRRRSSAAIRERSAVEPVAAIVLGSGLGGRSAVAGTAAGAARARDPLRGAAGLPRAVGARARRAGSGSASSAAGRSRSSWAGSTSTRATGCGWRRSPRAWRARSGARAMVLTTAVGAVDPALRGGSLVRAPRPHQPDGDEPAPRAGGCRTARPPFVDVSRGLRRSWPRRRRRSRGAQGDPARVGGRVRGGVGARVRDARRDRSLPPAGATVVGMRWCPRRSRPGRWACGSSG